MSTRFLLQTVLLLWIGQVALGGLGWLLSNWLPWAGLLVTLALVWFICRVAHVFRDELQSQHRGSRRRTGDLPLKVGIGVQLPSLLLLPFWAPAWILTLWQGALLPAVAALDRIWPGIQPVVQPWLWLAAFAEIALFAWMANPPQSQKRVREADPLPVAVGEWAPARRLADVPTRGLRVK